MRVRLLVKSDPLSWIQLIVSHNASLQQHTIDSQLCAGNCNQLLRPPSNASMMCTSRTPARGTTNSIFIPPRRTQRKRNPSAKTFCLFTKAGATYFPDIYSSLPPLLRTGLPSHRYPPLPFRPHAWRVYVFSHFYFLYPLYANDLYLDKWVDACYPTRLMLP